MFGVGSILGAHGLKGEVRVFSRTDFPELRFSPGARLWMTCPGQSEPVPVVVAAARLHRRVYIVRFEGYTGIDQVERLRGCELKVSRDQLPVLPEGEYYVHDLIGCRVVDERGQSLGVLTEVLTPGANDVYVVIPESGRQILLPAIPDCILDVDVAGKRMQVRVLPGLLD